MTKLFRAIRAEFRKLWCKRSSAAWLMISAIMGAFVVFCCASLLNYVNYDSRVFGNAAHFSDYVTQPANPVGWETEAEALINSSYDRWRELSDIVENGTYLQRAAAERAQEITARESAVAAYRIEHSIAPGGGGMWRIMPLVLWLMMQLICLVCAVAASDMFAGEYSRGTIYMNLARPVTRIKQYFAKMITAWIYGALLLIAAFAGAAVIGALLLGDDGGAYVGFINGAAYHVGWKRHCLAVLGCCMSTVVMCITLCGTLGTLTRSRAVSAVGASAVVLIAVWLGSSVAPVLGHVSGLSVFSCIDLTVPLMTAANFPGLSFADCCVSCGAHLLIFFILGYYFMRRDISS